MSRASDKVQRATAKMLLQYPWWSTLFLNLRVQESASVPTMGTDGTNMLYNPKFTESLSDSEVLAVLMHETAHCALLHPYRRRHRHPVAWNVACDKAVNALLAAEGLVLPKNGIPPGPLDKTAEELYDEDMDSLPQALQDLFDSGQLGQSQPGQSQPGQSQPGQSQPGQSQPGQSQPGQGQPMSEQGWKDILAGSRGLQPASLARAIAAATENKVNWRETLAQFIHSTHRSDWHTWAKPSRRLSGMPGWKREPEHKLAVCVDTSGSISDSILAKQFLNEVSAIITLTGTTVYLISCDADVHQVIMPGEPMPIALTGGGGTDFRPAITKSLEFEPDAIVYFTDGQGSFPQDCAVPVLWALTQKTPVPFGQAIQLEEL